MARDDAQDALKAEILQEGRQRAEGIIAAARAEAEKAVAAARAAAQSDAEKVLSGARDQARRRADMILRSAGQEISRRKLRAREEIIQQAMDQAEEQMSALSGEAYREVLARLSVAAIREMRADRFIVKVAPAEGDDLRLESLPRDIAAALAKEGRMAAIRIEPLSGLGRGVLVESEDGRMRWDNTLGARLRRLRSDLRRQIAPVLFEKV
jgi:V/A-type H+-transporting ATPase subunit E